MFAGSNTSGLFKTIDGGINWYSVTDQLLTPGLGINSIAIDQENPDIMYISTGTESNIYGGVSKGVLKSIDGGETWQQLNIPVEDYFNHYSTSYFYSIKINPTNSDNIIVGTYRNLWVSQDAGATWLPMASGGSTLQGPTERWWVTDIEFDPTNGSTIFASTTDFNNDSGDPDFVNYNHALIFKSTDFGVNWSLLWQPNSPALLTQADEIIVLDFTPAAPGVLYAAYLRNTTPLVSGGNHFRVDKSSDGGLTWNLVYEADNDGTISPGKTVFEVSNNSTNTIYFGGINFKLLYKNEVEEIDWHVQNESSQYHDDARDLKQFTFNSGKDFLISGNDGSIVDFENDPELNNVDNNNDLLWNSRNGVGLHITQIHGLGSWDKTEASIYGAQDNGSWRVKNSDFYSLLSGDGSYATTNEFFSGFGIIGSQSNRKYTKNEGVNNSNVPGTWDSPSILGMYITSMRQYFSDKDQRKMFIGGNDLATWQIDPITKNLVSGTAIDLNGSSNNRIRAVAIAPSNGLNIYVAFSGQYWDNPTSEDFSSDHPNDLNAQGELINKVFRSTNGGISFSDITNKFKINSNYFPYSFDYINCITVDPRDANHVFVGMREYRDDIGAVRVLESTDAGETWNEMSAGLAGYGIHQLLYQDGSDEILYAATDGGVYRWNKALQTWECFNNGLPPCIVTSLDIDYCEGTIVAGTYGKGIWKIVIPTNNHDMVFSSNYTIDTYETHTYENNVIVETGATLEVKGHLSLKENKKIIVRAGGKLIIDGGMLTNKCGSLWQGIEVLGNYQLPQTATNQGTVEMLNGAIITNARIGIRTIQSDPDGNLDWTKTGGIVQVKDSHFINNRKAIEFMSYHNGPTNNEIANVSYIKNCDFESNDLHHFTTNDHSSFVTLWDVNGVRINGCRFNNNLSFTPNYPLDRGSGIISAMATYYVTDHCTNNNFECTNGTIIRNEFSGMSYAIRASGPATFNSLTIDHAKFTNNYRAVYLSGFGNATVTRNQFDWAVLSPNFTYGLYLNNCTGYEVEENTFNGNDMQNSTGMIIRNSGQGNNLLYKNTFGNLNSGTTILGVNDETGLPNFTGLQIWCNDYRFENDVNSDNNFDIFLGANASIADYQGDAEYNKPAGNRFWATMEMGDMSEINLTTNAPVSSFEYITHDPTMSPETYPTDHSSEVGILISVGTPYSTASCPSNLSKGKVKSTLESLMVNNHNTHTQLKTIYNAYINNGEGMDLSALIADPSISEVAVKTALMAASPKVSDQLMLDAMHRIPALTGWHMAQVLVANSPLRTTVIQEMKRMGYQPFYEQLVENTQNGTVNTKNVMEMDFAWYGASMGQQQADLKRLVIAEDETTVRWTELNTIKGEQPYFMSDAEMIAYYYDKGDLTSANTMAQNADLTDDQIALIVTSNTLRIDGLNATGLTSSQVLMLENIAYSEKLSACTAAGILEFWNIAPYDEPIEEPNGQLRSIKLKSEVVVLNWISILPNPTNDLCHLVFKLPEGFEKVMMQIIDPLGRTIESKDITATGGLVEYDTKTLATGMYNVQLTVDGINFGTATMIVQH